MLKKIGTYAREDMEKIFSSRIYLDIWVKVRENWRDQPAYLSTLGYSDK
jgi:GTP-binding protein Era